MGLAAIARRSSHCTGRVAMDDYAGNPGVPKRIFPIAFLLGILVVTFFAGVLADQSTLGSCSYDNARIMDDLDW